jgi:hypothetical protein
MAEALGLMRAGASSHDRTKAGSDARPKRRGSLLLGSRVEPRAQPVSSHDQVCCPEAPSK